MESRRIGKASCLGMFPKLWLLLIILSPAVPCSALMIGWGVLKPQFPAEPAPEGELSGRLLDGDGHALSKVRVICFCESTPKFAAGLSLRNLEPIVPNLGAAAKPFMSEQGVTDEDGKFSFKVGRTQSWLLVLSSGASGVVHVGPAQQGGEWRVVLRPHASVEGVFRVDGKPAPQQALAFTQSTGLGIAGLNFVYTTKTDDHGYYRVEELASPHPWRPLNVQVSSVVPASDLDKGMPLFYLGMGGSLTLGNGVVTALDTVVLHTGEKFTLALNAQSDGQGRLIQPNGSDKRNAPSSTGSVWLHVMGEDKGTPHLFLLTSAIYSAWPPNRGWAAMGKGNWESRKFPNGDWTIQAGRMVDGKLWFSDVLSAKVEDNKTTTVNCELKPGAALKGKLSDNVPRPVRDGYILVWVQPAVGGHPERHLQWEDWARVAEDGTFVLDSLPPGAADYVVTCNGWISESPPVRHPLQWAHGGPPLTVAARSVTMTRSDTSVVVPMVQEGACRVKVLDAEGKPAVGIKVKFVPQILHHGMVNNIHGLSSTPRSLSTLVPASAKDNGYHTNTVWPELTFATDVNGVALVEHIPPVEETIFALQTPEVTQYIGGSALTIGEGLPDSQVVSIKPGQTATATVTVPRKE